MEGKGHADSGFLGRPPWHWATLAFVTGLMLAIAAAALHARVQARDHERQVARLAERSFDAIERQLHTTGLLVRLIQTLFHTSDRVEPEEFAAMYANLRPREQFPSLQALAYAERRGDPRGGLRYPTTLVAPLAGNEALGGLDVATQPVNLRAAILARDTDQPVMSMPFRLIQPDGRTGTIDGVTIRLPVFAPGAPPRDVAERRAREAGTIAVSFRVTRLIADALPAEAREQLRLSVADVGDDGDDGEWPLYGADAAADGVTGAGRVFVREIRYGTRAWRLRAEPRTVATAFAGPPMLTFALGLIASLLLAALAWSLAGTRQHALALARGMSRRFRESEERFRALNELLPALVLLADAGNGRVVYANQACRDRFSIDIDAGETVLADIADEPALREQLATLRDGGEIASEPVRLRSAGNDAFWATLSVARIVLDGRPHLLAVANDTTELRVLSDELNWQSSHDLLTGLPNRREFERELHAMIDALDAGATAGALLYLDLDQFKLVNDTSGHYAGDQLLAHLATLLPGVLPAGATLSRVGGDEFAVLLPDVTDREALAVAERLRQEIDGYVFGWEQRNYTISASIGAVTLGGPGLSLRTVLTQADTACYMAKERGRNRVHLFSAADSETARRRSEMEWAGKVREALAEGRFELHFQQLQPLWDGDAGTGVHVELLIRMRDEQGAMVPPGAFIPAAERFGLMPQIDRWVVDTALANFNRLHPSGKPLALCAINLSGPTFEDATFADFVLQRLEDYGVAGSRICFEITETAAVSSMSRAIEFMQRLRGAGCRFSLDDFGSGMASFGYLKNLPVDFLKIDGSFIRNIESDPISYSIVRAVTDIGHQHGLQVVAEWVGDERARDLLRGLSVDYAQGFAVHRPEATLCFRASQENPPG